MTTKQYEPTFSNKFNKLFAGSIRTIADSYMVDVRSSHPFTKYYKGLFKRNPIFLEWLDKQGIVEIDDLTAAAIRNYLLSLLPKRTAGGQNAAYRVIQTWLFWWERETDGEYRASIRKVKRPKVNHNPLPGISKKDIETLHRACSGVNKDRDRAIIYFLFETGVRATELLNIDLTDVDFLSGGIVIRNGKGGKRRIVYIYQKTRRELRKYLKSRTRLDETAPLFTTDEEQRLTYSGLRQIIRRQSSNANIATPGLHDFRRAHAVSMLRNGCDVITLSRLMGHSDLQVLTRYLAQNDDDLRIAHQKASPVDMM